MTIEQIERLAAAHSHQEGGQRLGTADPSPWRYHPELASLADMQTVTVKLTSKVPSHDLHGGTASGWDTLNAHVSCVPAAVHDSHCSYLTACLTPHGHEFFVCHAADVDERVVIEALLVVCLVA